MRHPLLRAAALALCGFLFPGAFSQNVRQLINPGETWPDDRGQHIQAHGGGILKLGDTYYWFGEDRARGSIPRSATSVAIRRRTWRTGNSATRSSSWPTRRISGRDWVLERPKVFYNAKTKKFVMYMHIDGTTGGEARTSSPASAWPPATRWTAITNISELPPAGPRKPGHRPVRGRRRHGVLDLRGPPVRFSHREAFRRLS